MSTLSGGQPAQLAAVATHLPVLSINPSDVSYTPSLPRSGDTVAVRFRISNTGDADARQVPVALQVNGVTVAQETFDVAAGRTQLGGLEWQNAQINTGKFGRVGQMRRGRGDASDNDSGGAAPAGPAPGSLRLNAVLVIDPEHRIAQRSGASRPVALARMALLPGDAGTSAVGGSGANAQMRALLEVNESGCVGFRFAAGTSTECGSADVEMMVEDAGAARYSLAARDGIADLGIAAGVAPDAAGAHFDQRAVAMAGHAYAVQLGGGRVATFTLQAVRNPRQVSAKTRQVFRGGDGGGIRKIGEGTGPVETGDTSGVARRQEARVTFEILYSTP